MKKVYGIKECSDRCLRTERWGGNIVLMLVDAAFTSIGMNYFAVVVPKVEEFNNKFVKTEIIKNIEDLIKVDLNDLIKVWKNKRSWNIVKDIASYLTTIGGDKSALRAWARNASLKNWGDDPIGRIKGVGIITFQYLRMMGGIDTVMPDKIVKRVINEIFEKAGSKPVYDDMEFVKKVEEIALACGYKPVELCWMTWLVQPEGKMMRLNRHSDIISKI